MFGRGGGINQQTTLDPGKRSSQAQNPQANEPQTHNYVFFAGIEESTLQRLWINCVCLVLVGPWRNFLFRIIHSANDLLCSPMMASIATTLQ